MQRRTFSREFKLEAAGPVKDRGVVAPVADAEPAGWCCPV